MNSPLVEAEIEKMVSWRRGELSQNELSLYRLALRNLARITASATLAELQADMNHAALAMQYGPTK